MDIKFTISSRKVGWEQTYPVIVPSLIKSGVPPELIYFFVGGYNDVEQSTTKEGVNLIKVDQNSIDYTGLIGVLDLELKADYWVLLHDTCYVGPKFYKTILEFSYNNAPAVALSFDLSMNIGAYSWGYLAFIRDRLHMYRNGDLSEDSIQKWKQVGVRDEDMFLHPFRSNFHYCSTPRQTSGPVNMYQSSTPRIIEYYADIDLYKAKANWYTKPNYELNV